VLVLLFSLAGVAVYKNPSTRDLVSHSDSTSIRFDQYKRIWDSRNEIGLLGRGTGTAGPSSQNRIDGGPNHFTENIYLDIFEELGLLGFTIYLVLILSLLVYSYRRINSDEGLSAFMLLSAFFATGLFVNYYTGQAGIFLVWLSVALLFQKRTREN
jgi:O-antigen ligase